VWDRSFAAIAANSLKLRLVTDAEYARKLAEIDRLLNDPDVPMQAARVWELLAEIRRSLKELPDVVESAEL
jgi:hypothetical protein